MSSERTGGVFEPTTLRVMANLIAALLLFMLASVVRAPTVRPDLATLVVVFLALEQELLLGLALAAGIGYLSDLFSGLGPGLDAATNVAVYLVLRVFVARIAGGRFAMVTTLAVLATVLALGVRQIIEATVGPGQASLRLMAPALPSIVLGALLLAYPVYRVFMAIDTRFRPKEELGFGGRARARIET